MKYLTLFTVVLLALSQPVIAAESCVPNNSASRVLQSENPNDLSPDWIGESRIGLSWSLFVDSETVDKSDDAITYLKGSLVDPRGTDVGKVFVIKSEWQCS